MVSAAAVANADGTAGSSGDAGSPGPAPTPAQSSGTLPGIDVSHYQDVIDWSQVAGSGVRFAIAKATEGRSFVDSMYSTNKAGAEASGVAFTAYHFARPDDTPNDAIIEADHFVDVAQLGPGNLIPALDIERTGGLTQTEVTIWILTWLDRVTEHLGVRPMVYTSPNGWDLRTGDTTAVADAGYTVLWVAHWGVSEPRLPANEWSGNGWTFWQYGNCGTVPGIDGCVDVDRYDGTSLDPVQIPSPDDVPPSATFAIPLDVDGVVSVAFDEVVRQVTPENVLVWTPSTGTYPEIELTCLSRNLVEVDCVSGNVRHVIVDPVEPLIPGESYEAVVNPAGAPVAVVDRSGNAVPTTTQPFAPPTALEQDSAAVSYAWRTASSSKAFGGSYAVEHRAGASVTYGFVGPSVTWFTATGPAQGRAAVRIDGRSAGTFDQFATRAAFRVPRTFTGLGDGEHEITVRVLGRAAANASDTRVVVDGFEAEGRRVSEAAASAAWGRVELAQASAGDLTAADLAGASVDLTFRGTGVEWTTVRDRDQGTAAIYVDGVLIREVDNFATAPVFGVARSVTGLADGEHTLRIVVLGDARARATGTLVSVDRFVVIA